MDEEINLRDYINVLWKRKGLIVLSILVFTGLAFYPQIGKKEIYEAKVCLLLKSGSGSAFSSQLAGLQSLLGMGSSGGGSSSNNFPVILSSRAVAEKVLNDLNLVHRIKGWDNPEAERADLVSAVQKMVKFGDKTGLFEISATSPDPIIARDLANAYAMSGAEYWNKLNYTEARKKREYIESQLPKVEYTLKRAEANVKKLTVIYSKGDTEPSIEMKRLQRELEIQNATYIMLRKEYETAKLDEAKELNPFNLIDPAEVPNKPLPNRFMLSVIIGFVFGGFFGVFSSFFLEYWENTGKKFG
jgi:uncharacterized protein involved in exopolysaccharide biosynthesis